MPEPVKAQTVKPVPAEPKPATVGDLLKVLKAMHDHLQAHTKHLNDIATDIRSQVAEYKRLHGQ